MIVFSINYLLFILKIKQMLNFCSTWFFKLLHNKFLEQQPDK